MTKLVCCIVTRDHAATIGRAVELTAAEIAPLGGQVWVRDNGSSDGTQNILKGLGQISYLDLGAENSGFCYANNRLINRAITGGAEYILFVNPDAAPAPGSVQEMLRAANKYPEAGAVSPKIIRADSQLAALEPAIIDAAGMYFTPAFRHFDRGSNEKDRGQYDAPGYMAGGTAAALLLTRRCIETVSFHKADKSLEFFDERFFAYREDAEAALRMWRMCFKTLYWPAAKFYHVRNVLPERRGDLSDQINRWSVRNRFLMQLSHLTPGLPLRVVLGTALRNAVVILGVAVKERKSFGALPEYAVLRREGKSRRAELETRTAISSGIYSRIFSFRPYFEALTGSSPVDKPVEGPVERDGLSRETAGS